MAFVDNAYNGRILLQGIMPVKITITAACDVGDLIGYDNITSALWELADADGKIPAQLIAGEQNSSTAATEITCFKMATIDFGTGSTATPGDMVYLSDTAGSYAATPGGWVHQCVGQCITAQVAFIQPDSSPLCGFTTTGTAGALWARTEIASGKTSAATQFCGGRVDTKIISGATLGGEFVASLWVLLQSQDSETLAEGSVLRLEDNSSDGCGVNAFISCQASGADQPDFLFDLNPTSPASGCWDTNLTSGSPSGAQGQIKVTYATDNTAYIALYNTTGT